MIGGGAVNVCDGELFVVPHVDAEPCPRCRRAVYGRLGEG
jgi:hypothetical protein